MEKGQFENLMNELKIIKKLLTASLYRLGISSKDLDKITGMGAGNIRNLVSKKKIMGKKNAKKS
jgi:hypothetical protein